MSTEDLNLPASLERLEINPESRLESNKSDENPFSLGTSCPTKDAPECSLEGLSLKAVCPKGSCLCNKKKDGSGRSNVITNIISTRRLRAIVHHRRPILRRSKLNREVLRAPILKLSGNESTTEGNSLCKTSAPFKTVDATNAGGTPSTEVACCSQQPLLEPPTLTSLIQRSSYLASAATSSHCCALQARSINNNGATASSTADDTNIDELASYFDLFVHIPKKMSVMAEMMYI